MITDMGMKAAGQVFSNLRNLTIYNCPHLHLSTAWFTSGQYKKHDTIHSSTVYDLRKIAR